MNRRLQVALVPHNDLRQQPKVIGFARRRPPGLMRVFHWRNHRRLMSEQIIKSPRWNYLSALSQSGKKRSVRIPRTWWISCQPCFAILSSRQLCPGRTTVLENAGESGEGSGTESSIGGVAYEPPGEAFIQRSTMILGKTISEQLIFLVAHQSDKIQ